MALEDYKRDMEGCSRCSSCKWVPFNQIKSWRFAKNCPSICRYNFHAYSGSGRMIMGNSIHGGQERAQRRASPRSSTTASSAGPATSPARSTGTISTSPRCCWSCGPTASRRASCIVGAHGDHRRPEAGEQRPGRAQGQARRLGRGPGGQGHQHREVRGASSTPAAATPTTTTCGTTVRGTVQLLLAAGIDVGIAGAEESCCGGRAYELGYRGEAENFADDMLSRVKASGAKLLVTPCSDGYAALQATSTRAWARSCRWRCCT